MITDLRYALRQLLKSPAFTLTAVLTLALGIGANTAIFTVVNGLLLRPLPYPEAERLVTLRSNQSAPEIADVQRQSKAFSAVGGLSVQAADYSGGAEPIQVSMGLVTGDFFSVLGTHPALGRLLTSADDSLGAGHALVLAHSFWKSALGGDANIVGRAIVFAGQTYTIIGVTAPDFRAPSGDIEAFAPVSIFYPEAATARGAHLFRAYGKLRNGVSHEQAQSELRVIDRRMALANPDENKNRETTLLSLQEQMVGDVRPALLVLFAAVGLVLLIACANFANLLLARMASRAQELSIRAALGAGRSRLIGQVLLESTLLGLSGGATGLLLGSWGVDALLALRPEDLPRAENIHLDPRVLAFTFGLSLLTGLIFGILPAWQATRLDGKAALSPSGRRITAARSRLRDALVVSELALALVLLAGGGLLTKTFWRLTHVAPGFDQRDLTTLRVELPEARYREVETQTRFRNQVLDSLNNLPGVRAAMVSELPLSGSAIDHNFIIEGRTPLAKGDEPELYSRTVAGDYFSVLAIPLRKGRALTREDRANTPLVGVINESMAQEYFPNQDPLGARIRWAREEGVSWITIVGVVGDVRHFGLGRAEEPAIYTPYAQSRQSWKRWSEIVVRSSASVPSLTQLKQAIWKVDPLIPVAKVRSMSEVMSASVSELRFNTVLLIAFAAAAIALAGIGLYGVISYLVSQRTHEIGVRVALGAQHSHLLKLVLGHGFRLALCGAVVGILISLGASRFLSSLLYGAQPSDPLTFASVAFLLLVVALFASYIPARRAMRVDPIVALHYE
ncbi:MAG TPA: ABC transporter permease [Chthoniobacterales bacterium]|jgi:putative ABC transport system permease protein